jgi:DMSO/TMAO reductase YedYZ molybdopterin-dependent catalytic subunit
MEPQAVGVKTDTGALTVANEKAKESILSPEAFAKLPRRTVSVKGRKGDPVTYEGVTLPEILKAAGTTLGEELRGPLLTSYVLVEAADGYRVIFALPELHPGLTDKVVLLADRKDGKPLASEEGPYRLIVPEDKGPARWVKKVSRISVKNVAPAANRGHD